MKRVVILSPQFPPSTMAGAHRARHLAKHLPRHGWEPIVLTVDPAFYEEKTEPALAALVPPATRIVRVGAIPTGPARRIGLGDIGIRAFAPFARALGTLLREDKPQGVMITGMPFYPMVLSRLVRRSGVPCVLDFQDPWVSARPQEPPALSKAGVTVRLARLLEPMALRGAAFVTSVSDVQNSEMAQRYPWLDPTRMEGIPIGGDPDDFDALRARPITEATVALDPGRIEISYVGTFLPRSGPLVRTLFKAARHLTSTRPDLAARLRLNFVGTSNQPGGDGAHRVRPIAAEEGIEALVREEPRRVPFLEALDLLARSKGLLLVGSDEPHYTASKIYPALMSGTPYLSLFHAQSSADEVLRRAGGGESFSFGTPDELEALVPPLAGALERLADGTPPPRPLDRSAYAPFTADAVAGRFAAVFDRMAVS